MIGKIKELPLWKIIIISLIVVVFISFIVILVIINIDTIRLPKNSVTIVVHDQNGDPVNRLKIRFSAGGEDYNIEFKDNTSITTKNIETGDYDLYFESIPDNYNCEKINDHFSFKKGNKVRLEYNCNKKD